LENFHIALGFSGVQNFPTVGLIDGLFRRNLEETEMGYGLEVDMIRTAHELGLLTTPYCFNPEEAAAMARGRKGGFCGGSLTRCRKPGTGVARRGARST